jgi:hypothetical protein
VAFQVVPAVQAGAAVQPPAASASLPVVAEESTVDGGLVEWVRQLRTDAVPAEPASGAGPDEEDAPPWGGRLVAPASSTDAGWQPTMAERRSQ